MNAELWRLRTRSRESVVLGKDAGDSENQWDVCVNTTQRVA